MDELYNQYKKIKVVEPKTPSFAEWRVNLGLKAWEEARLKRTKKNAGGYVNKPMNVGRRSDSPGPSRNIKREQFLSEMAEKKEARKLALIRKAQEKSREDLIKQIALIEANALKY